MTIIVGLGNPGRKYTQTRHNIGSMVVARFARNSSVTFKKNADGDETARLDRDGNRLLLLRPHTYMNECGIAVRGFVQSGQDDLIVVSDELNLPLGSVRIRKGGSDGGHKGLRSIIEHLGTDDFTRVRLGINRPPEGVDPADFVLEPFGPDEKPAAEEAIDRAVEAVAALLDRGLGEAMSAFNRRASPEATE